MSKRVLLLTCEHGGVRVPARYRALFRSRAARAALQTHRASDHGALELARALSSSLGAPLYHSNVTRLLVDLNRSLGHPALFSEFSRRLDRAGRADLLERHYFPHRDTVESWIEEQVRRRRQVVHIGVHSFAPRVRGQVRQADLGLLYDPGRASEVELCRAWKAAIEALGPTLRVRRNYPFLGKADGFVTHLRAHFGPKQYIGIELELNQALLARPGAKRRLAGLIAGSLTVALGRLGARGR
jgi:predicted N-formylglutamate amidohydrolase